MKLLLENWRNFKNKAKDPDDKTDDKEELLDMAPEINREFIEKIIGDFSFNSAQSSQHRWSPRQPVIDYRFDERNGNWAYMAAIPDGTNDADNWPTVNSNKGEGIGEFLTRVKESPHQLNLFENWRKYLNELTDFDISDYRRPESDINILKNKLGIVYRLGKPLVLQSVRGEEFKVTYNHPNWLVTKNDEEQEALEDIPGVVDYLAAEGVDFKTAQMLTGKAGSVADDQD